MRRTAILPSFLIVTLTANAQQPVLATASRSAQRTARTEIGTPSVLPVSRVALYKSGVGFFEHAGRVTGDQSVSIDFTTSQLNDVLQSLTAIDLNGGRIAGAGYNSTTPLEQQLRALPLALGQDPTPVEFYNSIRGARVEVSGPGVAGGKIAGRLFNIEVTNVPGKDGNPGVEQRVLTVIGEDGGVRTAELTPATEVRLLDTDLHQDVTRYLQLLAGNRNQGLRHLTLQDNGTGVRDLRVSYISEVPIWKATYRILFTDATDATSKVAQTATLQGWSVVDNTTGADWVNVNLSLIAGAPQSFIQPLSVPYYSRRPEIGMPQAAQLAPQMHESGEAREVQGEGAIDGRVMDASGAVIGNARVTATNLSTGAQQSGQTRGDGSFTISPLQPGRYRVEASANGFERLREENVAVRAQQSSTLAMKLSLGSASETVSVTSAAPAFDTMNATLGGMVENRAYSSLPMAKATRAQDSVHGTFLAGAAMAAPVAPPPYEQAARESLAASAGVSAFDDYFKYDIAEPITIRKNESALVPILQAKIGAERVTLWGPQHPVPLRALWVTNTSKMTLDQGSFSIVEDGNFGGEGLLDAIHPAEKRLLSYAVDQAVRVTTEGQTGATRMTSISAAKGVLVLHNSQTAEVTYVVRNAAPEARTVVIEHPVRAGYVLDSGTGEKVEAKPEETTPGVYRYKVQAAAGETVRLHVGEHHSGETMYRLMNSNDGELNYLLNAVNHNPAAERAIQPILEARRHVAEMQNLVDKANTHRNALRQDEERQRTNITALANADKSSRERFVRDLNATEDQLAAVQKEIEADQAKLQTAEADLASRIEALQIQETL